MGIFTGYFPPHLGGVERYTDKMAASLREIGYDVVVVTSNHENLGSYEKSENYALYRLPILKLVKSRYPIPKLNSEYRRLISRIEKENIDYYIINNRFYLMSLTGSRIGKRRKKPVMLIEHGTNHFTVNNKLLDFLGQIYEHSLTRLVKKNVDKFYGVSKKCNEWSKHFGINASGVFYNYIDKNDEMKADDRYIKKYRDDEIIITFAGRLIKEKGILNLIEAFRGLDRKNMKRKPRLVIAGDGELLDFIKEKYKDEDIDILGKLDFEDVMALFKRTDIFVHPSMYPEGLPTVILEAGLMSCAIIATPKGGTEEVIIDDEHGIIVDGSVEQLKDAMEFLINNDRARIIQMQKIKTRIKEHFERASVSAKVDQEIEGFKKYEKN